MSSHTLLHASEQEFTKPDVQVNSHDRRLLDTGSSFPGVFPNATADAVASQNTSTTDESPIPAAPAPATGPASIVAVAPAASPGEYEDSSTDALLPASEASFPPSTDESVSPPPEGSRAPVRVAAVYWQALSVLGAVMVVSEQCMQ